MNVRAKQREETSARIIAAAIAAFSEHGFNAASTRDIAERAGTRQGLLTYHFASKDELWRAAVNDVFAKMAEQFSVIAELQERLKGKELAREVVRVFTRFAAAHPEQFRIMVSAGYASDDRMRWLVDTHLQPLFDGFEDLVGRHMPGGASPHGFYAVAGAASTIFAVAPECKRLTSLDPSTKKAVEAHANYVAELLVP